MAPTEKAHATSIDDYIESAPPDTRPILQEIREIVSKEAPGAQERISYRMPVLFRGGVIIYFAAFTRHIGTYPPVHGDTSLENALARYRGEKGNLRFPLDEPIPYPLIRRVVRARLEALREAASAPTPSAADGEPARSALNVAPLDRNHETDSTRDRPPPSQHPNLVASEPRSIELRSVEPRSVELAQTTRACRSPLQLTPFAGLRVSAVPCFRGSVFRGSVPMAPFPWLRVSAVHTRKLSNLTPDDPYLFPRFRVPVRLDNNFCQS